MQQFHGLFQMNLGLSLAFGGLVGLSLGLTGGGGAILAVPMLVYGLQVSPREAISVSLSAVGVTAAIGFLRRWREQGVEVGTGLLFALAGMLGAPVGSWIATWIPESMLLFLFGILMLAVAIRMGLGSSRIARVVSVGCSDEDLADRPTCRRDAAGRLLLNTPCAVLLSVVGVLTGILSGMFGVGGGFIIVPALVLYSGMSMLRAVGTSLMVVALVSGAGLLSQWFSGRSFSPGLTLSFIAGGIAGLFVGQGVATRIPPEALQRVFAVAIILVAIFVIVRTSVGFSSWSG
jgi:uncharacterized membrane protein YfcA